MKRITLLMATVLLLCGAAYAQKAGTAKGSKTLVAYFSATGTTERVAQQIAKATGGTLFAIEPAQPYTAADLDWRNKASRSSVEMADAKTRPAMAGSVKNMGDYDTVYIGFPIWWDLAPHIVNTFIENAHLNGKTVIPFATSGSSSITNSEKALQKAYPQIKWQKGRLLNHATQEDINKWINK